MIREMREELLSRARRHHEAGELLRAEQIYRQHLEIDPSDSYLWYLLGVTLISQGKVEEAVASFQTSLKYQPEYAHAQNHLGMAFARQRQFDKAAQSFRQTIRLMPELAEAHYNLGHCLVEQGRFDLAEASYRQAVALAPNDASLHRSLGWVQTKQGRLDDAVDSFRNSLKLQPDDAKTHSLLGEALLNQGNPAAAAANFRVAVRCRPTFAQAHSKLLVCLHYRSSIEPTALFAEHVQWAKQYTALPVREKVSPKHRCQAPGRLRVGYVSAAFVENHPMACVIPPVLAAHDRYQFRVTAYADSRQPDTGIQWLAGCADEWRFVADLTDAEIAQCVRKDEIDILVDLSGHTLRNRLLVFAHKAAPIQVTCFGYPGTTGLAAMDYRITDALADPPGTTERYHTETLMRLPEIAWCYRPSPTPQVSGPPIREFGRITFGSFNNIAKITPEVIALWSRILRALPGARLKLMVNYRGQRNQEIWQEFARHGINSERVNHVARLKHHMYLQIHRMVDICLDPFPINGRLATCDALWMGVPVITLAGKSSASRQGVALLSNVGLNDLIAASPDAYVDIAVRLAGDVARLQDLRRGLRDRMMKASVWNASGCARNLEKVYQKMWKRLQNGNLDE